MDAHRTANRTRFIWRNGVLGWGVWAGLLYAAIMAYFFRGEASYLHQLFLWLCLLPLWAAGGYVYGAIMWRRANRLR